MDGLPGSEQEISSLGNEFAKPPFLANKIALFGGTRHNSSSEH
jgi:hypothetical protein